MRIWVDADACPRVIKEILYRVAARLRIQVTLVANKQLATPRSAFVDMIRVGNGFDVADNEIVRRMQGGDLIITADIPLAALVVEGGGHVIDPRGELLDASNIQERLTIRNFMDELRSAGVDTGGPPPISRKDRQVFANQLDRFLSAHLER